MCVNRDLLYLQFLTHTNANPKRLKCVYPRFQVFYRIFVKIRRNQIFKYFLVHFRSTKYLLVVLLYPDISNFTFWNVKNLKCKNFLIDFRDELGNLKQINFYSSKCNSFLHFTTTVVCHLELNKMTMNKNRPNYERIYPNL